MKKVFLVVIGFAFGVTATCGTIWIHEEYIAAGSDYQQVSIIERYLQKVVPLGNLTGDAAAAWEKAAHITDHLDGSWDCKDRAEYAKVVFRRFGYQTRLATTLTARMRITDKTLIGHQWLQVYKNGKFIKNVMKERVG